MTRHKWQGVVREHDGIEQCVHCETERCRDISTKTVYGYRRGRAQPPGHGKGRRMPQSWTYYVAGSGVPKCTGPVCQ